MKNPKYAQAISHCFVLFWAKAENRTTTLVCCWNQNCKFVSKMLTVAHVYIKSLIYDISYKAL